MATSAKLHIDPAIIEKLQTKQQLYEYLTMRRKSNSIFHFDSIFTVNLNLPIYKKCHIDFLHDVFEDDKDLLENSEVRQSNV